MHLNGDSMESLTENHEMLNTENYGLAERVTELERKLLEQNDELICLKATLAEALRRLNIIENSNQSNKILLNNRDNIRLRLYTTTTQTGDTKNLSSTLTNNDVNLKTSGHPTAPSSSSSSSSPAAIIQNQRKIIYNNTALPQRRVVHYQSTGSLHSDSQSSSSVSPAPSPRATPLPKKPPHPSPITSSSTSLHKRWSSTGDFHHNNLNNTITTNMHSKYSTKSFINLYSKINNNSSSNINNNINNNNYHHHLSTTNLKHGIKDATYNDDEKTIKFYLRGRPIILSTPDNYDISKVNVAPQQQKLKIDWVYGYRGRDCRSNLYYLPTGEMVYFVTSIVVLYNVEEQYQRHYLGHTDDVKCLAVHPSKMIIATGQCGSFNRTLPHIRIWNSISLNTQVIIGLNEFTHSICCLSFSKADGGNLLLSIDEAGDHNISIWEWQKGDNGYKITETKCSIDTIVAAEFHPLDRNIIVTCGKSHIAFWSIDINGTLYKRMGIFERDKPKYVTCISFLQTGEVITGDSNGNLSIWGRGTNTIWKIIKNVHDGPIFTICVNKDGTVITGGGKDGRIVYFNSNLQKTIKENQIEGHFGGVRVISEGCGTQLIIGTTKNCILNGSNDFGFQPIIFGHTDDIWGIAAHPLVQQFATAGHDKVLQLWDALSHNILWSKDIGEPIQSLAFSHNGKTIVVGCNNGKWMVFDTQTRELKDQYVDGSDTIQTIEFSPDGTMLALGSKDGNIYVYEVSEEKQKYNRIGRCMAHSSYITHMDWSVDNTVLRSNSGDYELFYWNIKTCRQITQLNPIKELKWFTNKCILTFSTIGIWPENVDGADVTCCDRSNNEKLLVSGDDLGKVKLYNYPASQTKSLCHVYRGHSSQVTGIRFLHDDTRLVSIGGKDTAILQWSIT